MKADVETRAAAAEAWRNLWEFVMKTRWRRDQVLERLELTPNDARALHTLDRDEGIPMSGLSKVLGTDASAATWLVDRLEGKGLVERRMSAEDRRVKRVVLTARGRTVREQLMRAFYEPPPEVLELSESEIRSLRKVAARLAATVAGEAPASRARRPSGK